MSRSCVAAAVLAGVALLAASGTAAASTFAVKPGLWEMRVKSKMSGEGLPPGLGGTTTTFKVCITPEDAKASWKDMVRHMQGNTEDECTYSDLKESGGAYSFTTKCKSGMSGTMKGVIKSTTMEQSGDMVFREGGQSMVMNFTSSGRWVADTCPPGTMGADSKSR